MKRLRLYLKKMGTTGGRLYLMDKIKLPIPVHVRPPDLEHTVCLRGGTSDIDVFAQIFIKEEYRFNYSPEPRFIIDAGANIGMASIYYATLFPNARIVAIEPEISNFKILERNIQAYPNITAKHCALWHCNTSLEIEDQNVGKFSFRVKETKGKSAIPSVTVDDLMQEMGQPFVDIFKIDIEGAEKQVFEHHPSWLSCVGIVVAELHDSRQIGCSRAFYTAMDPYIRSESRNGENIFIVTKNHR